MRVRIGLIGDYQADVTAHQAIPLALAHAADANKCVVFAEWLRTCGITSDAHAQGYDALWAVPGTPYENAEGALRAIQVARTGGIPFLGTCGGFQHAMIEYARNVWGIADAAHAESEPDAPHLVIVPLSCSMVEERRRVRFVSRSRLRKIYRYERVEEGYHCNYGLSREAAERMLVGPLRVAAYDDDGDVRAVELDGHPFFIATLFQPERRALTGEENPLIDAFVAAAMEYQTGQAHAGPRVTSTAEG